jgi:hypothetical protein
MTVQQSFSVEQFWREYSAKPFVPRVRAESLVGLFGPCCSRGDCLEPLQLPRESCFGRPPMSSMNFDAAPRL